MAKHSKEQNTKVIRLKDYQEKQEQPEPRAAYEYEGEDQEEESGQVYEQRRRLRQLPKAVYASSLALLAVIIGLALWVNRQYLNWDSIKEWAKLQVLGEEGGDGFPVQITGSNVFASNFTASGGSAVVLSNTALTVVNAGGKEEMSVRHKLNQPVLKTAGGRYLIFNSGSTGYTVLSGGEKAVDAVAEQDIITGDVAPNGKYALGLEGSFGASKLQVFLKDGKLQYEYPFAQDYITAVCLNYDGSFGGVCTVRSEKGEMVSLLTIFDFTKTEPVAQFETRDNLLLAAYWGENGAIYGVGDEALVMCRSSDYSFVEQGYQGRRLTAFCLDKNRAFLSISAYEHAGASTLMAYDATQEIGPNNPARVEFDQRIEAISAAGGTVGALVGGEVVFCDYDTGMVLARAEAGTDAKSLALASESKAYILGVSEIRTLEAEG
ncbi:DUF5711 family protein [Acutalibacter intestini]|uniref:DUF5711 family protein n=1 Tax=Acutalibacter intestini TaxID=3093659 RepID=UPI002AC8E659|nr:DUF5711 family protein [Acutalibacter sp. M00204]